MRMFQSSHMRMSILPPDYYFCVMPVAPYMTSMRNCSGILLQPELPKRWSTSAKCPLVIEHPLN